MRKVSLLLTATLAVAGCVDPPAPAETDAGAPSAAPVAAATPPAIVPDEAVVTTDLALELNQPVELGGQTVTPVAMLDRDTYLVRLDGASAADTLARVDALRADPKVLSASANDIAELSQTPNDPVFSGQWHHQIIRAQAAWDHVPSSSARIAFLDTGSTAHDDITWATGYNTFDGTSNTINPFNYHHGTMVAGLAGARANNNLGGVGVCWGCQLIPVRANSSSSGIDLARAVTGLNWLANYDPVTGTYGTRRTDVVNLSFNTYAYSNGQRARCATATETVYVNFRTALERVQSRGILVTVSAGNGGPNTIPYTDGPEFPADCADVIATAAIEPGFPGYGRAFYSSSGLGTDLAAPGGGRNNNHGGFYEFFGDDFHDNGVAPCPRLGSLALDLYYEGTAGIVSTWSIRKTGPLLVAGDHCYRYSSGTSYAAPHVAGVAGLMLGARPTLTRAQLEHVLKLTAMPEGTDLGFGDYLSCPGCGAGLVDAFAAVDAVDSGAIAIATATPQFHDFGNVNVGASSNLTVAVGNIGDLTLNVSSTTPMTLDGPFSFAYSSGTTGCMSGQSCARTYSVLVGGTANVPIRCNPSATGAFTGTLRIRSSSVGELRVPLTCTGTGAPPFLSAPSSYGFGNVRVGTFLDGTVVVTNAGGLPLTITSATTNGAAFSRVGALPGPIAGGQPGGIGVRCTPPSMGLHQGTLTIMSNGGNATVQLTCTGTQPVLWAPPSFAIGTVRVGASAQAAVPISNTGNATLTVTGVSITGSPYITSPPPLPGPIAPGGPGAIQVRCAPLVAGVHTATLMITSDGGTAFVALSCTAVTPFLSAPASFAFGNVRVGSSLDGNVVVTNIGSAPLVIASATTTGAAFSRVGALPGPIGVGLSASIGVRCTPPSTGPHTGTLAITSDGGNATVQLTCTGVAPAIATNPTWLEFGSVMLTTSQTRGLQVSNPGTAPLVISSGSVSGAPFVLMTAFPITVPAGGNTIVNVRCSPTVVGYNQGTLTLTHDAGRNPSVTGMGCNAVEGKLEIVSPANGVIDLTPGSSATATVRNVGVGPIEIAYLAFDPESPVLAISGVTLPATLAVGESLSWQVDCYAFRYNFYPVSAKLYAKHDGVDVGSLFSVSCDHGIGFDPPIELPIDPTEPPATE